MIEVRQSLWDVSKINVTQSVSCPSQQLLVSISRLARIRSKGFDPRKLLAPGAEAIKATVKEKMELFGSVGKA